MEYQRFFKGYLRLVAALDDNIGRLLDYLDQDDLTKNTVVIYTSDNGFFLGDFGLFNKMWMYEESLRLPLLVRYPDHVKPEIINTKMVSILDFAPTILDYARAEIPKELQGRSIRAILEGKSITEWREGHYYHYYGQYDVPAHVGVRTSKYKLIHYYNEDYWELYDMVNDPRESQNIYSQSNQSEVLAKMNTLMEKLQLKYEGVINKDLQENSDPDKK